MFRGPFLDESSDEEATAASEQHTTTQAVLEETSSALSNKTTSTPCPTAPNDPFLQPATRNTRPSLFFGDPLSQTMTESEIAEVKLPSKLPKPEPTNPRAQHIQFVPSTRSTSTASTLPMSQRLGRQTPRIPGHQLNRIREHSSTPLPMHRPSQMQRR